MTDRLTPDALRARVRAAIGEPEISSPGFDLAEARKRGRGWFSRGWGIGPAPVRVAAFLSVSAALVAVLVVGIVVHVRSLPLLPAGPPYAPAGSSSSRATATPGLPAQGFVPGDVTAVSASQWWVLGTDGAGCASASCTRVLQTADAGRTFTSIPTPPASVDGLRFADPQDGWAYSSTTVWSTHDGGGRWNGIEFGAGKSVTDLETSGSFVYAVVCSSGASCSLERSPTTSDAWTILPIAADLLPEGVTQPLPGTLNVHGSDLWMAVSNGLGDNRVIRSTDDGGDLGEASICSGATGVPSLYAVSSTVVWATCAIETTEGVWLSQDGGATFAEVPLSGGQEPSAGTIAATSATTAVLAGRSLQLTVDGGKVFTPVESNGNEWGIVGFTTSEDGFAFSSPGGGPPRTLWRTVDGGAQWYEVQFP